MANPARGTKAKRKSMKDNGTSRKKVKKPISEKDDTDKINLDDASENNQGSNDLINLKNQMLEKVEEELKCNICTEFLIKPTALSCSHTFCEHCITQWKRQQFRCPICREKIYSESPVLALDLFIEKFLEILSPEKNKDRNSIIASREKMKSKKPRRSERLRTKRQMHLEDLQLIREDNFHLQDFEENFHLRDLIDEVFYLANQVEFATVQ